MTLTSPEHRSRVAPASDTDEAPAPTAATSRLRTSFWSLGDQCLVSLGNFGTNILLARYLASQADYGLFGLTLGILMFLNNLHGSLITYPLSVRGAGNSDGELRRLATSAMLLTLLLAVPVSLSIFGVSLAAGLLSLAPWIVLSMVFWQLQEVTRRALMSHLRYREALWGDAISYIGQAAGVWYLMHIGRLALPAVFILMAGTSAAAAILQFVQLRLTFRSEMRVVERAKDHWELGRWMVFGNLIGIVNIQVIPWTLTAFHGLGEAAKLYALGNIVGVTHPAIFSVMGLVVPATARTHRTSGARSAVRAGAWYAAMGSLLIMPYFLALAIWPQIGLRCFFGPHSPYLRLGGALRFFILSYVIGYIAAVTGAMLSGLARSRAAFMVQLSTVVVTLTVTLPLAWYGGVMWGLAGGCLSVFVGLVAGSLLLRRAQQGASVPSVPICSKDAASLSPSVA